jgi:hypothetical protein
VCGARKRQPKHPGERCARPAGWGTEHLGFGRCKLHGGATPYKHGFYSKVVREFVYPSFRWKMRAYDFQRLRMLLARLIPDPERRGELLRLLAVEAGLVEEEV